MASEKKRNITWKEMKKQKVLIIWSLIIVVYGVIFCYLLYFIQKNCKHNRRDKGHYQIDDTHAKRISDYTDKGVIRKQLFEFCQADKW